MKKIPQWVKKFKEKGTEIKRINNRYYLYQIKSVWDPQIKRARKITNKYLGVITPKGLIKPRHERILEDFKNITVKEFGASSSVVAICSDIIEILKRCFPYDYEDLVVFSIIRFFYSCPLKNVQGYYVDSHLSDLFCNAKVSPKSLSELLSSIGKRRGKIVEFLKNFVIGAKHVVIDLTHVFSFSENVISASVGYNSEREYIPQINFILVFSLDKKQPSFFRIVPGSIRDVSAISLTLKEASIERAVVIGDKGIYSATNVEFFEKGNIEYILPLKRDCSFIDYTPIKSGARRGFDGYFLFEKRVIWYYERKVEGRRVILFFDEKLKMEEEKDFILHVENKRLDIEEFYKKELGFGTIALLTNTSFLPQKVFELLKGRVQIEILFDTFKNLLQADRTYVRDDTHLEGWMFINFIALLFYYRVYRRLAEVDLIKKFSPKDIIIHLSRIRKLKVGGEWVISEIPKTSRKLLAKLGIELRI